MEETENLNYKCSSVIMRNSFWGCSLWSEPCKSHRDQIVLPLRSYFHLPRCSAFSFEFTCWEHWSSAVMTSTCWWVHFHLLIEDIWSYAPKWVDTHTNNGWVCDLLWLARKVPFILTLTNLNWYIQLLH